MKTRFDTEAIDNPEMAYYFWFQASLEGLQVTNYYSMTRSLFNEWSEWPYMFSSVYGNIPEVARKVPL